MINEIVYQQIHNKIFTQPSRYPSYSYKQFNSIKTRARDRTVVVL